MNKTTEILKASAAEFGLKTKDLTGPSRLADIVQARHIAMALMHETTSMGLHAIAKALKKKEKGTVIHALRQVKDRMSYDLRFSRAYFNVRARIRKATQ
jgi:chromosomal replication initiator protein